MALLCVCVLSLAALTSVTASVASSAGNPLACANAELRPDASNTAALARATLCLVNQLRGAFHLPGLRANGKLRLVAVSQVRHMVLWDYFADVRPSGQTPLSLVSRTGYRARATRFSIAENIAWGTESAASPASIVAAWMADPPHRAIMLTAAYHDAGVAAIAALPSVLGHGRGGAIYAIEFGTRR